MTGSTRPGSHIGLGDAQLHAGDPASARKNWEQALAILESIPHQDAEQARARLNQLVSSHSGAAGGHPGGVLRRARRRGAQGLTARRRAAHGLTAPAGLTARAGHRRPLG